MKVYKHFAPFRADRSFYHYPSSLDGPASYHTNHRPIASDVASDAVFSKVSEHIKKCWRRYKRCPAMEETPLPTRVIDVEVGEDDAQLKLDVEGGVGHYVALSYCWGQAMRGSTTTRSNIASRVKGIDLHMLPKTIQDSVRVTRELGFRHLWVDALCILQDDVDDKAKEITFMNLTYKRAAVTFSAAVAKDSSEGFPSPRYQASSTSQCLSSLQMEVSEMFR